MNRHLRSNPAPRIAVDATIAPRIHRALGMALLALVWATPVWAQTTQVVEYYHTDALGSVRAVTKAGVVVSRHDFMPFGEEVQPTIPPPDKRLFVGKERDAETATDHFEARNLRPDLGRFQSVDRIFANGGRLSDPQSINRYAYARNNPLKYIDPDGLSFVVFSRADNKMYLFDSKGVLQGPGYDASNNASPGYTMPDGIYPFRDTRDPFLNCPDDRCLETGSIGPHGMFRVEDFLGDDFVRGPHGEMIPAYSWHTDIGIHSGRLDKGFTWWTNGCVRTTDEGMEALIALANRDPLTDLIMTSGYITFVRITVHVSWLWLPGIPFPVPIVSVSEEPG